MSVFGAHIRFYIKKVKKSINHISFKQLKEMIIMELTTTADLDLIYLLHKRFSKDKIKDDSGNPVYDMYMGELEQALTNKGFDLNTVYKTKDGRFKVFKPFQVCRKSRKEVLEKLFNYYYPQGLCDETFHEVYIKAKENIAQRVNDGLLSTQRLSDFTNYFKKYVANHPIANKPIKDIKASTLDAFFKEILKKNPMTKSSFSHLKWIFNETFDKAILMDLVEYNVSLNLNTSKYRFKEQKEVKPYSQEERAIILNELDLSNPLHLCIGLMFCLNIRVGELRALRWDDVDFDKKTIYIHAQMQRQKDNNGKTIYVYVGHTKSKKEDGNRYLRLSNRAIEYLNLQRKNHPFGYIFVRPDGQPFTTNDINHCLERDLCAKCGVEYRSTHKNRFRAITESYRNGVDEEIIRQSSGHTTSKMTEYYNRSKSNLLLPNDLNEAING